MGLTGPRFGLCPGELGVPAAPEAGLGEVLMDSRSSTGPPGFVKGRVWGQVGVPDFNRVGGAGYW